MLPTHASVDTDVYVENIMSEMIDPSKYVVMGHVVNAYDDKREVVLRAQIAFFDRTNPVGDLPVSILRKDTTVFFDPHESKQVRVELLNEGPPPEGALRREPMLRIRRVREWTY